MTARLQAAFRDDIPGISGMSLEVGMKILARLVLEAPAGGHGFCQALYLPLLPSLRPPLVACPGWRFVSKPR